MRILVVADIHGDFQALTKILDNAEEPDIVICPGNLTDMFRVPPEFSQVDVAEIVVQKLLSLGKPVLCLPGNHDTFEVLDLLKDYEINLHSKHRKVSALNFIGFGGAKTPFHTNFEPSEEETREALSKLPTTQPLILVTHNPPKNTSLDRIKTGEHVGSQAVRDFILSKKPLLTITAHIHEVSGEDHLGPVKLFSPGPAFLGSYGMIEFGQEEIKCRTLKV